MIFQVLLPFSILFPLLFIGIPVGFSLGIAGVTSLLIGFGPDVALGFLATVPYRESGTFALAAIPLFLLMGQFALHAGISKPLIDFAYSWLGRLPGGLALAAILASAMFAAATGSSTASVAALTPIITRESERFGYNRGLMLGTLAASGTFAVMIPPSIVFIVYGVITDVSIGKLFIAGILPGVISAVIYMISVVIRVRMRPSLAPPAPPIEWRKRLASIKGAGLIGLLLLMVLGSLFSGVATPSEAGAIGAVGTLLLGVLRRRPMNWGAFSLAVIESVKTTAMLFMIIIMAYFFANYLSLSQIPQKLVAFIAERQLSPWVVLTGVLVLYSILGMFLTATSILVATLPIVFPLITAVGFDPIWFGVIVVKCMEIGLVTPPVGLNLFIIQGMAKEPLERVISYVLPFLVCDVATLILLILVPEITLFLPSLM